MSLLKEKIITISDEILNYLLEYKTNQPDFTFALRTRDSVQSKEKRLENGQWFQGSDYIYVPLLKRGDSVRKVKTLGFVLTFNKDGSVRENYLEVSYKGGIDVENEVNFHKELAEKLEVKIDQHLNGQKHYDNPNEYINNLHDYITNTRAIVFELLKKYNLLEHKNYIVSEKEFQKNLSRIKEIKKNLGQNLQPMQSNELDKYIKVLRHKKQIILQGPPGTGKTFTAKRIAEQITGQTSSVTDLTPKIIKKHFKVGQKIANSSGKDDYYTINSIDDKTIELQSDKSQPWRPKYDKIILKYNELINGIKPKNVNDLHPYELAVAKHLFNEIVPSKIKTESNFSLVQFHPSYSYEDFVRGISVKNENDNIVYKTENKIIAKLSKLASKKIDLENYNLSIEYSNYLKLKTKEAKASGIHYYFDKKKTVRLLDVHSYNDNIGNLRFEINYSSNWEMQTWINIEEEYNLKRWKDPESHKSSNYEIPELYSIWQDFDDFVKKLKFNNYVLIIDEINRANLPSVLGELIYALEYRGEPVHSMYAIDGDSKITVPENLYIIGTMNTADRSVGHIDYAIKRRFAFVEMLPNVEVITNENAKALFNKVSELFTKEYLASDFDVKDVHLGHSYFLLNENSELTDTEQLQLKLNYEILPILNEYIKDGLLLETAKEKIKEISEFEC